MCQCIFFFNDTATTEIYTLSRHDALPISIRRASEPPNESKRRSRTPNSTSPSVMRSFDRSESAPTPPSAQRSEEHTSELQSRQYLVCRLLLEKKKTTTYTPLLP